MKFAKLIAALGMVFTGGFAQAQLSIDTPSSSFSFSGYDGQPATVTGTLSSGIHGTLWANAAGTATFTYLGQESGYANLFKFSVGSQSLTEGNNVGDFISGMVGAGALSFSFDTVSPAGSFANGTLAGNARMVYVANKVTTAGTFDYVIGFNDSCACDGDYDDFVVGVKFANAVPEPETYAMLLAGLGLLGFAARRRKLKLAA